VIDVRKSVGACPLPSGMRRHARGFTLVELMITLVVAVILIAIAVPSFRRITLTNKLTTTANDIVGAINLARMEAVKRNASTQLCSDSPTSNSSDTLGTACGTQAGAVYALAGSPAAAVPVRTASIGLAAPIVLTGNLVAIRFSSQGLGHLVSSTAPYTGPIADVSTASIGTDNHRCVRMAAGSILTTTMSSTACPTT
jgi:type IV fimbrial biogenesis protein FimT